MVRDELSVFSGDESGLEAVPGFPTRDWHYVEVTDWLNPCARWGDRNSQRPATIAAGPGFDRPEDAVLVGTGDEVCTRTAIASTTRCASRAMP